MPSPPRATASPGLPDKSKELHDAFTEHLILFAKMFKRWDVDRTGTISRDEFRGALRTMELPHADEDELCDEIFDEVDVDHSGLVSQYECHRYAVLCLLQSQASRLHTLFKLWDVDNSGAIDRDEFRDAIKAMGIEAPSTAVDQLFKELDEDKSGELDYEELDKKLRSPKGRMAQEITEASPAKANANLRALAAATAIARMRKYRDRNNMSPASVVSMPKKAAAQRSIASSSLPPSPGSTSDDDDNDDPLADGAELAQYLFSTRLDEAQQEHTAATAAKVAEEAKAAQESSKGTDKWPYRKRHPPHTSWQWVATS